MTAREMTALLGQTGVYVVEGLSIPVTVFDARLRFGSVDVQIVPVNGGGSKWTPVENVDGLSG